MPLLEAELAIWWTDVVSSLNNSQAPVVARFPLALAVHTSGILAR